VSLFGLFEAKIMNSMKIGEGSSSGDEPRKKDLLAEMQITDQHAKELEGYSFEEILALTMEQLIAIFGAAKGILYSNRLEKIRKRLNLGKNHHLSSPKLIFFLSISSSHPT